MQATWFQLSRAVVISGKVPTRIAKDDELVFFDHKQLLNQDPDASALPGSIWTKSWW